MRRHMRAVPRSAARGKGDAVTMPARGASSRPRLTGRAAVLAVVLCGIALSLAYPVREFIAQRREISQLTAQRSGVMAQIARLERERVKLRDPSYVEQLAEDKLHMCLPAQTCYVIIGTGPGKRHDQRRSSTGQSWYERLWSSVQQANGPAGR